MTNSEFIERVGNAVWKYAYLYGIDVHSPIIAQAILESGWGKSQLASKYHNYFGLKCGSSWKGRSVNMTTKEEYTKGNVTTIKDNFRVYDSLEDGIMGYFDFINTKRYSNLKGVTNPTTYIERIKADGYATSSSYVNNLKRIIKQYELTKWDRNPKKNVEYGKDAKEDRITDLAERTIAGEFGNGLQRKASLGKDYDKVQARVNELLRG